MSPTDIRKLTATKIKHVHGKILSQTEGTAIMLSPIIPRNTSDKPKIRNSMFSKFEDGTDVNCAFNIRTDGSYTLVGVTLIIPEDVYQVYVTDLDTIDVPDTSVKLGYIANTAGTIKEILSENVLRLAAVYPSKTTFPITYPMSYDEAYVVLEKLAENHTDFTFSVSVQQGETQAPRQKIKVPSTIGTHVLSADEQAVFSAAAAAMERGSWLNLLLKGQSGYGKTTKLEALAKFLEVPFILVNCAVIQDPESWFGQSEARDGSTLFDETEFSRAIQDGKCVICLDEINRISTEVANPLLSILDNSRKVTVHNKVINVAPGIVFGATVNLGIKYAGTFVMDAALLNRFDGGIEVFPMAQRDEQKLIRKLFPELSEDDVTSIMAVVKEFRETVERQGIDVDVSTRSSIKIANMMKYGMNIHEAIKFVILNMTSPDDRKPLQDVAKQVASTTGKLSSSKR